MQLSDFDFVLPEALIAQTPPAERSGGRLLEVGADGRLTDRQVRDFDQLLGADDLVIVNDTRVMKARLFARKASGGQVELLVERCLDAHRAQCFARSSKPLRPGARLTLEDATLQAEVLGRQEEFYDIRFDDGVDTVMQRCGHIPLPPYIQREDVDADAERYQTVFARHSGAVAAPTAGLHVDEAMLERLRTRGVALSALTLHVGAGTFMPVRSEDLDAHRMHSEHYTLPAECVAAIEACRARGGRVVAIGTTVLRALESAAQRGELAPHSGETRLFIRPGYRFAVVDALLTNFHLPKSTLLMLVSAFAGVERIRRAYAHAIAQEYRFFSYGDAMFLPCCPTDLREPPDAV